MRSVQFVNIEKNIEKNIELYLWLWQEVPNKEVQGKGIPRRKKVTIVGEKISCLARFSRVVMSVDHV